MYWIFRESWLIWSSILNDRCYVRCFENYIWVWVFYVRFIIYLLELLNLVSEVLSLKISFHHFPVLKHAKFMHNCVWCVFLVLACSDHLSPICFMSIHFGITIGCSAISKWTKTKMVNTIYKCKWHQSKRRKIEFHSME